MKPRSTQPINDIQDDDKRQKPDYIVKIRTEDRTTNGKYGYYTIGAAYLSQHGDGNVYLNINFPNPFLVDDQTKIVLFPNSQLRTTTEQSTEE